MNTKLLPWIEKAYRTFAYEGPGGLKVERLAKEVGKNKSSFYHHFVDLPLFTDSLLEYHLAQAKIIAHKEAEAANIPDLISVLTEHKVDLLFNRQLRIHRSNRAFATSFEKTNALTGPAIIKLLAEWLELQHNSYLAELVLRLSLENFYLQITDETLNESWLTNYFQELRTLSRAFKSQGNISAIKR